MDTNSTHRITLPELLSPAGSFEGLRAALGAGADAVYLGGSAFGARAYAKNFDEKELLRAIDLCHLHGRRLYLTVNTLVKNREMEKDLISYLTPFVRQGVDAVLVQDFGVVRVLKHAFPDLPLHASTQMAVTGPEGMAFLEELGFARVVPARELTLDEIREMHRRSRLEIETFIHGAMCYSYSGMCLMSSLIGGRSGNRGRCAQPCRLAYRGILDGKERKACSLISMKDLNTVELLPELVRAGIASLKIEGRMKQPEYTAGVTRIYRKYLDLLAEKGPEDYWVDPADQEALLGLFSRGGSGTGYYMRHNSRDMIDYLSPEKKEAGSLGAWNAPVRKIKGFLTLQENTPAAFTAEAGEARITVYGEVPQKAKTQPMTRDQVLRQAAKTGDTEFEWEKLEVQMGEGLFVPVRELNALRREALQTLEKELCEPFRRRILPDSSALPAAGPAPSAAVPAAFPPLYVSCGTWETAVCALEHPDVSGVYLPMEFVEKALREREGFLRKRQERDAEAVFPRIYLSLPSLVRGTVPPEILSRLKKLADAGLDGFLVHNLEGYALLKRLGYGPMCVLDHTMYTWNDQAVAFFESQDVLRMTAPLELNAGELSHRKNDRTELLVYGYLPVMISAQCVRQDLGKCDRAEAGAAMKDRYGNVFPVKCCCRPWKSDNTKEEIPCYNIIYNSVPFSLLKEKTEVQKLGMAGLRLNFTREDADQARRILEAFCAVYAHPGDSARLPEEKEILPAVTKGHFHRGVQ